MRVLGKLDHKAARVRDWLSYQRAYFARKPSVIARPLAQIPPADRPAHVLAEAPCVFVLSTGRCGTRWLTDLLRTAPGLDVDHAPSPELVYPSLRAWRRGDGAREATREAAIAARYEAIASSWELGRTRVETNNRITFFAWGIAEAFAGARFVHLTRHPVDFVASGLARAWYVGHGADCGRLAPEEPREEWDGWSQAERIAWLWDETNRFATAFGEAMPPHRYQHFRFEDVLADRATCNALLSFVGGVSLSEAEHTRHRDAVANATPRREAGSEPARIAAARDAVRARIRDDRSMGYVLDGGSSKRA